MKVTKTNKIILIMLLIYITLYIIGSFIMMNLKWISTVTEWSIAERSIFTIVFIGLSLITLIITSVNVPKDKT